MARGGIHEAGASRIRMHPMNESDWNRIEEDFTKASVHFRSACQVLNDKEYEQSGRAGTNAINSFCYSIEAGHRAMEAGLERILGGIGEKLPASRHQWHSDLLDQAGEATSTRPAILTSSMRKHAHETRRTRHVFHHDYGLVFDLHKAGIAALSASALAENLIPALFEFRRAYEQPE